MIRPKNSSGILDIKKPAQWRVSSSPSLALHLRELIRKSYILMSNSQRFFIILRNSFFECLCHRRKQDNFTRR